MGGELPFLPAQRGGGTRPFLFLLPFQSAASFYKRI